MSLSDMRKTGAASSSAALLSLTSASRFPALSHPPATAARIGVCVASASLAAAMRTTSRSSLCGACCSLPSCARTLTCVRLSPLATSCTTHCRGGMRPKSPPDSRTDSSI
jgi:hypothetical protein